MTTKPHVGLVLGSGAALGLAHVGVLKVIEAERIKVDILAGASIGALIGALWAFGKTVPEVEHIVLGFDSKMKTLKMADLTMSGMGLIKGNEIRKFLTSHFAHKTLNDFNVPIQIIAYDIESREEVVLKDCTIVDALMAAVAIPGIFEPVKIRGRVLVDGGIMNPLPVNILKRLGVPKIIAVNVLPSPEDIRESGRKITNIFDVIMNSMQASEYLFAEASFKDADILIHPVMPTMDWYEFYAGKKAIKAGEEEAMRHHAKLHRIAVTWPAF